MRRVVGSVICAASVGVLFGPAFAAEPLPPPIFDLKQEIPTIGSHIPRKVMTGSQVPINRRYAELTEQEREIVRSRYEAMMPLDEPPYPADGLMAIYRAVSEIQRKVLAQGELSMFADIDAQGHVTTISVMKSPDPTLTRALANVLMLTQFKPAVCRGQPCAMGFPLRVTFTVDR